MARISRRRFLQLSAGTAAALPFASMPRAIGGQPESSLDSEWLSSPPITTLDSTIVKGALLGSGTNGSYYRLTDGPGEPFMVRTELGAPSSAPIDWAFAFVHFTDIHLIDAQSPGRVEFLDRFADMQCQSFPLNSAFRPQETLQLQVMESMIRRIRAVRRGPASGTRFRLVICTGDNVDNEQFNELRWFVDMMDGGQMVTPNSGDPSQYEGVQAASWGDAEYWHPDPVGDKYKQLYGFPDYPGLLDKAIRPIPAAGVGLPWWQTFGNHDGLMQGNAPRSDGFNAITVGPLKFDGPPPGINPCDPFASLVNTPPTHPVTADPNRRIVRRHEYVDEHFNTSGAPVGHGFTDGNRMDGTAYYVRDDFPRFRFISLDTVNPGGYADGSVGATQFAWLEQRLIEVHRHYFASDGTQVSTKNKDRLVVLFSHHGLRSLNNPIQDPNPDDPGSNDLPRIMADQIEALVHRFPNVIAWVNGHTHDNVIDPRPDPSGRTNGFWDVGTAAHVDWSSQCRIVEVARRRDGTISIFCTIVDHAAPADPTGVKGIQRLASIHRELSANDFQYGFASKGHGELKDRNAELRLPAP